MVVLRPCAPHLRTAGNSLGGCWIAAMGTNALAQFDGAVVDLKQRISKRVAHLQRHLFAPAPALTALSVGGEAQITHWLGSIEHGKAMLEAWERGSVGALKRWSVEG